MADVEARVEALVAAGELGAAAEVLVDAGEPARAIPLYERACDFEAAARAALAAGENREAVRLAVLGRDDGLCKRCIDALVGQGDADLARRVAADLNARAYPRHGARIHAALGDHDAAADAFERAGMPLEASASFDAAGRPADGARVLESAIRAGHEEDVDRLRVALGRLYARHGKHRAAVRVLQQLAEDSDHRRRALAVLVTSLKALGLRQALRDLQPELDRRGIDPEAPEQAAVSDPGGGGVLYGQYEILREVATTPHARLLEAKDTLSGERVAVKILASKGLGTGRDAVARFEREARALAQLRHPSVVPMRAFVQEGPAIVLAWMGGGSLEGLLAREAISPARAAEIARALLDALAEAHRLGVLHRDVKPANVLFDDGGAARLADFGAAHLAESEATVTVGAIGTAAYMAPEQRAGQAASVQTDLFGVGVVLYEMLTGHLPDPVSPRPVSETHPDLTPAHDALLARLMDKSAEARPGGALEARRAVERLTWSPRLVERDRHGAVAAARADDDQDRLGQAQRAGDAHDRWLGRDVLVRALEEASLAHAAAFARANHPALATVLRADPESKELWLEAPRGRPLAQGLELSIEQRRDLEEAVAALHRAGGHHGAIDQEHVYVADGAVHLAYPQGGMTGSPEDDLEALAAVLAPPGP